jgi:hypothetical protein
MSDVPCYSPPHSYTGPSLVITLVIFGLVLCAYDMASAHLQKLMNDIPGLFYEVAAIYVSLLTPALG